MPMMRNTTSPFQALILLQSSHLYLMPLGLDAVYFWLTFNGLSVILIKLNYSLKPNSKRSNISDFSLSFHGTAFVLASSARNLGFFQTDFFFDQHISSVCR